MNRAKKYKAGYDKLPESEEEIAAAEITAVNLLSQEPWEDESKFISG